MENNNLNLKIFKNGLITGLILQFAIGPVFFFILNLTLYRTIFDGFMGVLAVTIVDYLYITLAVFGIGRLLEKDKIKNIFGFISSIVLIIFGFILIKNITSEVYSININQTNLFESFSSVFFITIFNPMTIIFFTSLFTAKVIEYKYTKKNLLIFGLSTGLATIIFMGFSVILFSFLKENVPLILIQILNFTVGCLLIIYGILRLVKIFKNKYAK